MPLLSDLKTSGGRLLYDLVLPPGFVSAAGSGATATTEAPGATVFTGTPGDASGAGATAEASAAEGHGYRYVTLVEPFYFGPGSIFYPGHYEGTPTDGDVVRYPLRDGFTVLPDGTVVAEEYGSYDCIYYSSEGETEFTITIDENAYVYADGAEAQASAPDEVDLFAGVNVSGTGVTATTSAPSGGAVAGNIATGTGATATASAAQGSVTAAADAEAEGATATATAAEALAEPSVAAEGAGATATATAAEGAAAGAVVAEGEGVTVVATPAEVAAIGDRLPGQIPYAVLTVIYPKNLLIAREEAA